MRRPPIARTPRLAPILPAALILPGTAALAQSKPAGAPAEAAAPSADKTAGEALREAAVNGGYISSNPLAAKRRMSVFIARRLRPDFQPRAVGNFPPIDQITGFARIESRCCKTHLGVMIKFSFHMRILLYAGNRLNRR